MSILMGQPQAVLSPTHGTGKMGEELAIKTKSAEEKERR